MSLKLLKYMYIWFQGAQSNARYTQLRERQTQWDKKAAAIYKIGRKSSYNIIIQGK
jgi:hypothetical protein